MQNPARVTDSFEKLKKSTMSMAIKEEERIELLMFRAWEMLRDETKKIGTIASELGFVSHSSFSNAFKQYYKKSPRSIRAAFLDGNRFNEQVEMLSRREVQRLRWSAGISNGDKIFKKEQ